MSVSSVESEEDLGLALFVIFDNGCGSDTDEDTDDEGEEEGEEEFPSLPDIAGSVLEAKSLKDKGVRDLLN